MNLIRKLSIIYRAKTYGESSKVCGPSNVVGSFVEDAYEAGFRKAREMINQKLIDLDSFDWDSITILSVGEEEVKD